MNNIEFGSYIDNAIKQEILLGAAKDQNRLTGLRNIKTDFDYITSKNNKLDVLDVLKKLYKERVENTALYESEGRRDLWIQEHTERELLKRMLPKEPSIEEVHAYLDTLIEIPRKKSSFKQYQDACIQRFNQKIDSNVILSFINEK